MSDDKSELFIHYWQILGCLRQPEREYVFCSGRKFRFDFAFADEKLAVEVDGGQWLTHGGRHSRDSDREKMNLAAMLGWRVMHFTPQMITDDPKSVVEQVQMALVIH